MDDGARPRHRGHQAGRRGRWTPTARSSPVRPAPRRAAPDGEQVLAALLALAAEVRSGAEVACGVGSGGPMSRGGERGLAAEHPRLARLPASAPAGRDARPPCAHRQRRQGPRARRGVARGRAGASAPSSPWSCRPASAAGSCSTAACSTGPTETPVTSVTWSSCPTAGAARAGAMAAWKRRRPAPPSRRGPGAPAAAAPLDERRRVGRLVGRAVGSTAALLDLRLALVAGSVALGFGDDFFSAAQAELDRTARIEFAARRRDRPAGLGDDGPLVGAAAVAWRALGRAGPGLGCVAGRGYPRQRWTPPIRPKPMPTERRCRPSSPSTCPADWKGTGALDEGAGRGVHEAVAQHAPRPQLPRDVMAGRVRRPRPHRARAGDPGRGVRQGGRARGGHQRRLLDPDGGQHAPAVGHRRAEAPLHPADPVGGGHLVPGLLGAQRRLRPRQPRLPGHASTATSG